MLTFKVVRDPSAKYHSLVMEYVDNIEWKTLYPRLTEVDIKYYMFQLLKVRTMCSTCMRPTS
jgi:casein kinase II subunit alpha